MLRRIRESLAMPRSVDPVAQRAVEFLYWAHVAVAVLSPTLAIAAFAVAEWGRGLITGGSIVALAMTLWSYLLLRRGYVQVAAALLCVVGLLLVTEAGLLTAHLRPALAGGYAIAVLLAGLLVGWRAALLCGGLSVVSVLAIQAASVARADGTAFGTQWPWSSAWPTVAAVALVTALVAYLVRQLGLTAPDEQPDSGAPRQKSHFSVPDGPSGKRLDLLRSVVELASAVAPLSERDEIARRSVELVAELPGVEWAGLFLLQTAGVADEDAGKEPQVVLVASAGSVGASIALPGERIALSASPPLALCIRRGEARVVEPDSLGLCSGPQELVPAAGSAVLLPLRVGQNASGALLLHVLSPGAGGAVDMDVAQMIADQIAASLHGADVYAYLRSAADRAERAVQRHIESSWNAVTDNGGHVTGSRYTSGQAVADNSAWLPPMADAVRGGMLAITKTGSDDVLAAPLTNSGVVIGAVGLRRPVDRPWTEEEMMLVQAVVDQVTQALENRRLFELARDRALRERVLRRITERVRGQADLDGALAAAADQMREITGATQVAIRLARAGELAGPARDGQKADGGN